MCGYCCLCLVSHSCLIPSFLCAVTHLLSPNNDPVGNFRYLKVLLQRKPTVQLPYLAPVACHPARRRAAAQTAADAGWGSVLLWTLCRWECFRKVAALAQNNSMLESRTTFGGALERKQMSMNNNHLKIEEDSRKASL